MAIVHSPLAAPRLPLNYLKVIKQCVLRARPTQKGCRSGVDARRAQSNKCYPRYALINAQSVLKKGGRVVDLTLQSNLEIMAVTETWLLTNEELLSICPDGFTAVHRPRGGPTKGGGIAHLYRDSIRLSQRQNTTFSSFEYMDVSFSVKSTTIRQVIIYRPPKESKAVFFEQFSDLLEMIIVSEEKLLITGDFNINMLRGESDVYSRGLSDLFESFGLVQHVSQVTHIRGNCHLFSSLLNHAMYWCGSTTPVSFPAWINISH